VSDRVDNFIMHEKDGDSQKSTDKGTLIIMNGYEKGYEKGSSVDEYHVPN
jgi:hypothetical protein